MDIKDIFKLGVEMGGSDISLVVGMPPCVRVDGDITRTDMKILSPTVVKKFAYGIMSESHIKKFEDKKDVDFAYSIPGLSRFRINVHLQRGTIAVSIRILSGIIPSLDELGIPFEIVEKILAKRKGLILVSGPTGSGKSTTLASLINVIKRERMCHIFTIEDPIEFLHDHDRSIVEQREVYQDTGSFGDALKYVLRQDPDVILVGEMRDLETISLAITAAETGHLVFSTVHTPGAADTISRIVDVFPSEKQSQIRVQLGGILEAVLSQYLVPSLEGGRALIMEVLIGTIAIKNMIRKGSISQIRQLLETGGKYGMITIEKSLEKAFNENVISRETMENLLAFHQSIRVDE